MSDAAVAIISRFRERLARVDALLHPLANGIHAGESEEEVEEEREKREKGAASTVSALLRRIEGHLSTLKQEYGVVIAPLTTDLEETPSLLGLGKQRESLPHVRLDRHFEWLKFAQTIPIPHPDSFERTQARWEEQLDTLEELQSRHGVRAGEYMRMREEVQQLCDEVLGGGAGGPQGSAANNWGKALGAWLKWRPTYQIPAGADEREVALWRRIGVITDNEVPPAPSPSPPRTLADLYAVTVENRQRYDAARRRWESLKRAHQWYTQRVNELMCDITLKLDILEERRGAGKQEVG